MADAVSVLALKIDSKQALTDLVAFRNELKATATVADALKDSLLQCTTPLKGFSAAASSFISELKNISFEMKNFSSSNLLLKTSIDNLTSKIGKLSGASASAGQVAAKFSDDLRRIENSLSSSGSALSNYSRQIETYRRKQILANDAADDFQLRIKQTARSQKTFTNALQKTGVVPKSVVVESKRRSDALQKLQGKAKQAELAYAASSGRTSASAKYTASVYTNLRTASKNAVNAIDEARKDKTGSKDAAAMVAISYWKIAKRQAEAAASAHGKLVEATRKAETEVLDLKAKVYSAGKEWGSYKSRALDAARKVANQIKKLNDESKKLSLQKDRFEAIGSSSKDKSQDVIKRINNVREALKRSFDEAEKFKKKLKDLGEDQSRLSGRYSNLSDVLTKRRGEHLADLENLRLAQSRKSSSAFDVSKASGVKSQAASSLANAKKALAEEATDGNLTNFKNALNEYNRATAELKRLRNEYDLAKASAQNFASKVKESGERARVAELDVARLNKRVNALASSSRKASFSFQRIGTAMYRLSMMAGGVFSIYSTIRIGKDLLATASDMEEAGGKFSYVLGRLRKEGDETVDSLAKNFLFSRREAKKSMSTMVDIFTKSGLDLQTALNYSTDLTKRAADLAAFTNAEGGTERTSKALTNAMLGFGKMAQSLGVVVHAADVEAQMLRDKMDGITYSTIMAAKASARYTVIMKRSASAQGHMAREENNLLHKTQEMKSRFDDLKVSLGATLVDPTKKGLDYITKFIEKFNSLPKGAQGAITKGAIGASGALGGLGSVGMMLPIFKPAITLFSSSLKFLFPTSLFGKSKSLSKAFKILSIDISHPLKAFKRFGVVAKSLGVGRLSLAFKFLGGSMMKLIGIPALVYTAFRVLLHTAAELPGLIEKYQDPIYEAFKGLLSSIWKTIKEWRKTTVDEIKDDLLKIAKNQAIASKNQKGGGFWQGTKNVAFSTLRFSLDPLGINRRLFGVKVDPDAAIRENASDARIKRFQTSSKRYEEALNVANSAVDSTKNSRTDGYKEISKYYKSLAENNVDEILKELFANQKYSDMVSEIDDVTRQLDLNVFETKKKKEELAQESRYNNDPERIAKLTDELKKLQESSDNLNKQIELGEEGSLTQQLLELNNASKEASEAVKKTAEAFDKSTKQFKDNIKSLDESRVEKTFSQRRDSLRSKLFDDNGKNLVDLKRGEYAGAEAKRDDAYKKLNDKGILDSIEYVKNIATAGFSDDPKKKSKEKEEYAKSAEFLNKKLGTNISGDKDPNVALLEIVNKRKEIQQTLDDSSTNLSEISEEYQKLIDQEKELKDLEVEHNEELLDRKEYWNDFNKNYAENNRSVREAFRDFAFDNLLENAEKNQSKYGGFEPGLMKASYSQIKFSESAGRMEKYREAANNALKKINEIDELDRKGMATEADFRERERLTKDFDESTSKYYEERNNSLQIGIDAEKMFQQDVKAYIERYKEVVSDARKDARQGVSGQKAIDSTSSEAFSIYSKTYQDEQKALTKMVDNIEQNIYTLTDEVLKVTREGVNAIIRTA